MDNKRWLLDNGYIPSDTLSELMDLVMKEQRQLCADAAEEYVRHSTCGKQKFNNVGDACLNATGESDG